MLSARFAVAIMMFVVFLVACQWIFTRLEGKFAERL